MDIQTLVEKYLNGQLTPDEVESFEKRLQADSALTEELNLQKSMQNYLLNQDKKEAFKKTLDDIGNDFFNTPENNTEAKVVSGGLKNKTRWLTAAAAAAALALIIYFIMPRPDLYQQYAQHQPLQLTEKSSDQTQLIKEAERSFNSGDYQTSLQAINQLLEQTPGDLQSQLVKSICLIENHQTEAARAILTPISKGQSAFKTEASWYIALSYLRDNRLENARTALTSINTNDPFWSNKIQQLLSDL